MVSIWYVPVGAGRKKKKGGSRKLLLKKKGGRKEGYESVPLAETSARGKNEAFACRKLTSGRRSG